MRYLIIGVCTLVVGLLAGAAIFDYLVKAESKKLIKAYDQKLHEVCDRCLK